MEVVIGVDVHKRTHTMVAVDELGRKVGQKTVAATSQGHASAKRWARAKFGDDLVWGIEDCRGLTGRLERDLLDEGFRVVRVPPLLMSQVRASSREPGKSDPIDALAVARAVLREPDLPLAFHNPMSMELQQLVRRREDLVSIRTATINRLVGRVHQLDPEKQTPNWKCSGHRARLATWLTTQEGLVAELALDELSDIERITSSMHDLEVRICERVRSAAPHLLELQGCGELTAATIIAEVADIGRFKSEAAFARYAGVAPVPHWSAEPRFRLGPVRIGNRQLNKAIHRIALTQIWRGGPGKDYFQRRLAEGTTAPRALRSLKRHITRVIFNRLRTTNGAPRELKVE
jgi:transposase